MVKQRTDREKTVSTVAKIHKEIEQGKTTRENTVFIVSHDILHIKSSRYEVVQITTDKPENLAYKILEVFDSMDAAIECKNYLTDLLYENYEI